MHHLLGAVHEASVKLSKLPIGDVAAALLQVLLGGRKDVVRLSARHLGPPDPPAHSPRGLTDRRSRRKRMLGTR